MIPVTYDYKNLFTSGWSPSTTHARNSALASYFRRYLYQKAISVFKWELPETWDKPYFLAGLYLRGHLAIIETDKYGVIPQWAELRGYNVFYEPTHAIIANPLLRGILQPEIGKQCAMMRLAPDWSGIYDIICYYANCMAIASEAMQMNLQNSKFAYVFGAQNKQQAESFKKMFDEIQEGNPATFIDKTLFREDGTPQWLNFVNNLRENFIAQDMLLVLDKIEAQFDTEIGIPNANTDKKERLVASEVSANNVETASKCELWMEELNHGIKQAKKLFGDKIGKLSVKWRVDPVKIGGGDNEQGSSPFTIGTLRMGQHNIRHTGNS